MNDPLEHITPLHNRVLVRHIEPLSGLQSSSLIVIRQDKHSLDGGDNTTGDYRRRNMKAVVINVGSAVRGVLPGQTIACTDWNDWADAPEDVALIREGDILGTFQDA